MKSPIRHAGRRLLAALALSALTATAAAAPTAQVAGGATIVRFSDTFLGAAEALSVAIGVEQSARLFGRFGVFPIPAGALDLESLAGDVLHAGGVSLTAGPTEVELLSFVIDTTSLAFGNEAEDQPVLTGIVVVNGDVLGRVPLFNLALNQLPQVTRSGRVIIRDVDVTLTATAADALNGVFGITDFFEGLPIGNAKVKTRVLREKRGKYGKGRGKQDD